MADPIQNGSYNYTPDYTSIDGPPLPEGEEEVLECRAESGDAPAPASNGGGSQPKKVPGNNAERTTARTEVAPYADAGFTEDAVFVGVALEKHRLASGHEQEIASMSLQVGGQMEAQAAVARLGYTEGGNSLVADMFSAKAAGGAHNDDGSTGFNASAVATLVGVETTVDLGDQDSVTFGLSASVGGGLSVGLRDGDNDGNLEFCFKVIAGPVTIGACGEN